MSNIKKFFLTSRYNKPHGILLLFFPCIWGIYLNKTNISEEILLCIIFFIGACGMRALGCIWNDYNDKDFDKKVERTKDRLIASNKVNKKEIIIFSFINLLIGSVPIYFIPNNSIFISFCVIPFIVIYPFMKRITWWPQLWLGICYNWGILVGYSVYNQYLFSIELILFYLGSILFTLGYDTVYGYQDLKDDQIIGVKSTSLKFKDKPKLFLFIVYITAFTLWINAMFVLNKSNITIFIFTLSCLLIIIKVLKTDINNVIDCMKTFNYNSYFSLAIMIILATS
ncbi:MAG: 4-hydroxybenzoate octaprenyltransferase [Pelagibacterales bacterium]|nr:4-hydroxybenzoate octaprenyltransferase [Pelagibacterales bacterium]OUU63346.1 MAG: 4-hydroxybenzoate polyprenyltransferase [Alphaproteobacteria bacterium TMED62]|tara:strand:- start:4759 stop:5607 length:849 start_codon:yes stop_codon:yes gene_type:complete